MEPAGGPWDLGGPNSQISLNFIGIQSEKGGSQGPRRRKVEYGGSATGARRERGGSAAGARRERDGSADGVPCSPGRQYQKNQYNKRPALTRSNTLWARGPANYRNHDFNACQRYTVDGI